jgi:hypothetical protein
MSTDTILHLRLSTEILVTAEKTREFRFDAVPPGTILPTPIGTKIERQRKRLELLSETTIRDAES